MIDYLKKWLEQMGCKRITRSEEGWTSTCPFHEDRKPSYTINGKTGLWLCWSNKCPYTSGNLVQLLMFGLGYSVRRALDVTQSLPSTVDLDSLPKMPRWEERKSANTEMVPLRDSLLGLYDSCPRYLLSRGFKKQTLREFEVGYDGDRDYAVIPCRDLDGSLVGLSKRACGENIHPKWVHEHFKKGNLIYNAYRARWDRTGSELQKAKAIVVEGQLDCIWMEQCGYPHTVSTLSAVVTDTQVSLLSRLFSEVTVFFDHDDSGFKGAFYLAKKLMKRVPTYVAANYPDKGEGKQDPSRLSDKEIVRVLSRRQEAQQFVIENAVLVEEMRIQQLRNKKCLGGNSEMWYK